MVDDQLKGAEEEQQQQEDAAVASSADENESGGFETACYRKCHGQFCLTPTENHFQHELRLDYSPFESSLATYPSATYERINALLQHDHSIDRIKQLLLSKHITCVDLCLFYLQRVRTTNDYHKIVIELNSHLLVDAAELDARIKESRTHDGRLFGCVAAVKGNISVRDMHNDAGAYVLHEKRMDKDAPIVRKLREEGCLILGRTNLSEWAYSVTENAPSGFSAVGGQCIHPDDVHEDVSGSSSGSAAGIKLNLFTFSLGTETQGSLLSPAINVRNVCTLKPTLGLWPGDEIIPVNYDQDSCGPMTRNIKDVELLHRIAIESGKGKEHSHDDHSRLLRVGYLGESHEAVVLLQALSGYLPLTTLVNLNSDAALIEPMTSVLNPTATCGTPMLDFLCFALARDIPKYLSSHLSSYSRRTLPAIVEWNSAHPEYIPYGQSLFLRALQSPISQADYDRYKQTVQDALKTLVEYLKTTYSLDCLLTLGNEDIFAGTTVCGVPRANLTLDYYNPTHQQVNVVAVGLNPGDDFLLLRFLSRLERANLQAGKVDTRSPFQRLVQQPIRSVYQHGCSIL